MNYNILTDDACARFREIRSVSVYYMCMYTPHAYTRVRHAECEQCNERNFTVRAAMTHASLAGTPERERQETRRIYSLPRACVIETNYDSLIIRSAFIIPPGFREEREGKRQISIWSLERLPPPPTSESRPEILAA